MNISFLGKGSSAAALRLAEILKEGYKETAVITAGAAVGEPDILAVLSPGRKAKCKMLIAPAEMDLPKVLCERRLFCGMSSEDDVTVSSMGDGECVAELRREMKTLSGRIVDRCEVRIKKGKGMSPEALLAVAGCALMLDVLTDKME